MLFWLGFCINFNYYARWYKKLSMGKQNTLAYSSLVVSYEDEYKCFLRPTPGRSPSAISDPILFDRRDSRTGTGSAPLRPEVRQVQPQRHRGPTSMVQVPVLWNWLSSSPTLRQNKLDRLCLTSFFLSSLYLFARLVANTIKTLLGIIYACSGVFPYDFDWGYSNSDVITLKKVL